MNNESSQVICRNEEMARDYLSWLRNTRGRTGGTVYNYAGVITPYLAYIGGTPLDRVKLHEIEAYVQRPSGGAARGGQGAAATQVKDVTVLRAFHGYLVARGVLKQNPPALLGSASGSQPDASTDTRRRLDQVVGHGSPRCRTCPASGNPAQIVS